MQPTDKPETPQGPRSRGVFLALEGLDGVGKTTQAKLLAQALRSRGWRVVLTQEPTQGPDGQRLRQILQQGRRNLSPAEELALFIADRREHVTQVILPALAAGHMVITDRYYYSSLAYQGALGLDPEEIRRQHETFAPTPDLVIILTLPLPQILERLALRVNQPADAFEKAEYLEKVGKIYAAMSGPHLHCLDARGSAEEVQARLLTLVLERLKEKYETGIFC